MSRSLIRKNQLHPDIADLVGQYGSGFFISDEVVVYISGNQTISGVKTFATGIFAPNLIYNTGTQTIGGYKLISGSASSTILQVGGYSFVTPNTFLGDIRFQASNAWLGASSSSTLDNVIGFNTAPSKFNVSEVVMMSGSSFLNRHGAVLVTGNQTISGVKTFATGIVAPNIVYNTGTQTISGIKTFFDSGIFSLSGTIPLGVPNNPLSVVGSGNTYVQLNIQNRATGLIASADLVITANNGTDSSNFINLGINNVGYNDPSFTNGTGLDGYLFIDGGNLDIGTRTAGRVIEFHAGGTTSGSTIARISQSGLNVVSGNLTVNNTGVLLSGSIPFVMNFGHPQIGTPTLGLTTGYFGIQLDAPVATLSNNERRRIPILQDCFLRKVAWTNFARSALPSGTLTGYFKNFGPNPSNDDKNVGVQVTTGMSIPVTNTMYNSISGNLNIPITGGDYVSFYYVSNFSGTLTVNYAVNVSAYFYV